MPYYIYVENINQTSTTVSEGDTVRFWIYRTEASTSETLLFSTRRGSATYDEGDYETTSGGRPEDISLFFGTNIFVQSVDIVINQDDSESAGSSESFGALLYAANGTTLLASLSISAVTILDVPPPLPNLTIQDVDVGSQDISEGELVTSSYSPGDNFSVVVDVRNTGDGTAASSVLGLYLVRNGTAQLVDTNTTSSLSAGSTDTNETLSFTLPTDLASGRYELLVKTDYSDSIVESDVGDNIQSFFIDVVANQPPEVTIEAASSYAAGTVLNGTDLISVTDPDGLSDIQNILVYDAINSPGAVWRFNGTIIDPGGAGNQFELNYDNLNLLTYTVGTGSDTFSFEARDFSGNISNEASHTITATTTETTYSLSPSVETIEEGDRTITFTVTRTGSNLIAETLYYSTLFGSASAANGDYDGVVDQELPFAADQAQESFTISINEDVKDENDETFRVMIATEENVSSSAAEAIATVTILDDDTVSTSTDYPSVQMVGTPVADPLDTISYGVNSYLTTSLDPFNINLEEQGEVTTRITRADDPDYEESVYWGLVLPDQPFEITFPGNHAPAGYEVEIEINSENGGNIVALLGELALHLSESGVSIFDTSELAFQIREFLKVNSGSPVLSPYFAVDEAGALIEKGAGFKGFIESVSDKVALAGLILDGFSAVKRIDQAEDPLCQGEAEVFHALVTGIGALVTVSGLLTPYGAGAIAFGTATLTYSLFFADDFREYVYQECVDRNAPQVVSQLSNVESSISLSASQPALLEESVREFDEDYYASQYLEATNAINSGFASNYFSYYATWGIAAGHRPSAATEPLVYNATEFVRPVADAASFGSPFALTVSPGVFHGDSLSPVENFLSDNIGQYRLNAGGSVPIVNSELTVAANRIAIDIIQNNLENAFSRQDRSNPDEWAEVLSSGVDFRTALAGIAWSELQLDSSVRMIALLTSETDPEAVYQQFIASAEGAAFLSDPLIQSIGVGEYGGLWVIVVDDVAYANNAAVSTEVLNNRQFGTNNADVVFAGASASEVSLFDGSDSFVGGTHRDIVRPGLGNDILTLGGGLDVVVGTLAELGGITITDFEPGDIIVLEGDYASTINRTYDNATGILTLDPFGDGSATAQIQLPTGLGVSSLLEGSNFAGAGYGFEAEGASGRPDASFSGYSSGTPNRELLRGEDFSTYFEVTNTVFGDTSFGQQVNAKVVFSRDYIVSQDDIFLGDFVVEDLATGEKSSFDNATVTLPSDMGTGEYYVGVVLDPENSLAEAYEINNVAWYSHTFLVLAPSSSSADIAETGTLTLNHTAQTVTLQRSYENPVVIAFVATENGAQPVNVRVSDVGGNDLTLQLQEPNYLDGSHTNETVNYLVVEAGTWILPDGTVLEAGTLNSNQLSSQGFETVAFDAEFDSAPVILSQVQTFNGGDFVTTRQRDANADSFQLTMQEEEALNNGRHVTETIGWIALEAGSGTAGDVSWLAGSAGGVTHATASVSLGASMAGGVNVIAALSSYAGADSAWARGNGSSSTTFDVSVEEDTSLDAETNHVAEAVDYFAFNQAGLIGAYDYDFFA